MIDEIFEDIDAYKESEESKETTMIDYYFDEKCKQWNIEKLRKPDDYLGDLITMAYEISSLFNNQKKHGLKKAILSSISQYESHLNYEEKNLKEFIDKEALQFQHFLDFKMIPCFTFFSTISSIQKILNLETTFAMQENLTLVDNLSQKNTSYNLQFLWDFLMKNETELIKKHVVLESYIPLLTLNTDAILKSLMVITKFNLLNIICYNFAENDDTRSAYELLCNILDVDFIKTKILNVLNSVHPWLKENQKVTNEELENHIEKLKESLKSIWLMDDNYAYEVFGHNLNAISIIETTVLIKKSFILNLEAAKTDNDHAKALFLVILVLLHEIGHLKRKLNFNFITSRTPKKISYKTQPVHESHGEAGFWLEENLFGTIINIRSLPENAAIYKDLVQIATWKNEKLLQSLFQNPDFPNIQQQPKDFSNVQQKSKGFLIGRQDPFEIQKPIGHVWPYSRCQLMKYFTPPDPQNFKLTFKEFLRAKSKEH